MITKVEITKKALRDLDNIPHYLVKKFLSWVETVREIGIEEVRKIPGYHDEPLKGQWNEFRSIRLNRSYRAIYRIVNNEVQFIEVSEVNKHEY